MSQELIDHSSDLKRLRDEGYEIEVDAGYGYALVRNVPYVNANHEIKIGILISTLALTGDRTAKPDTHVIYFCGEPPCNKDGSVITGIQHSLEKKEWNCGVTSSCSFSNKPLTNGYNDYYEKFTQYINILMSPAYSIDNSITARTYNIIETPNESVFEYYDTNTSRAEICAITNKMKGKKIGIVGLGGTGSYILDLIAKTPVDEIHLFDGDVYYQHNAFRSPGASSKEELREKPKKTDYFCNKYKKMHKHIISHSEFVDSSNIKNLITMDFIFICIDKGKIKKEIVDKLVENNISFIDVGIGLEEGEDSLIGQVRVTASTPQKRNHISSCISLSDNEEDNDYSTNIQIADLNALNAALAVIKWKKLIGFYHDQDNTWHNIYDICIGEMFNENN